MIRIGDTFIRSDLTGAWFPVHPANQQLLSINCGDGILIPIFSTREKYDEAAKWGGFQFAHCQEVLDHKQFFDSLLEAKTRFDFRLILDPELVNGHLRFKLVPLDESDVKVVKESLDNR